MSLGVMAKITVRPTKFTFSTLVGLPQKRKNFPRFLRYLSISIFSMGFCNLGFALLLEIFLGKSLNFSDIPCRLAHAGSGLVIRVFVEFNLLNFSWVFLFGINAVMGFCNNTCVDA